MLLILNANLLYIKTICVLKYVYFLQTVCDQQIPSNVNNTDNSSKKTIITDNGTDQLNTTQTDSQTGCNRPVVSFTHLLFVLLFYFLYSF